MQSIDVDPVHLAIIQNILKTLVPNYRVVAFGSRITQTARPTSDLDLCVMGNTPFSFETLAELRYAFSDSNLPYKVDVIDWATISSDFRKIVLEQCINIQPSS
jgi:type I restriction enzyme S subunit